MILTAQATVGELVRTNPTRSRLFERLQIDYCCGGGVPLANPIRQMEFEHDNAGNALAVIRQSTDDYQPPEWACNTYRAMLDELRQFEGDLHQHIHKENNVLFTKAIQFESQRRTSAGS